jgi:hypothetical protein
MSFYWLSTAKEVFMAYTLKQLMEEAEKTFDTIIDYYSTTEFLEVTGTRGGEYHTYRFYYSGQVTER